MKLIFILASALLFAFCTDSGVDMQEVHSEDGGGARSYTITDRTGKHWDISHAVNHYKMIPDRFRFGLGPEAFTPIIMPAFHKPGESGFPERSQTFHVIGVAIDSDVRAYPLYVLKSHEVVDDIIAGLPLAVVY